ncbi:hypothetical protein [Roseovarius sp. 2305UL8-3]|uniref:SEL1-like repeat protein n=1 Tax=Roseovarius conchicola TaxID=3121636 RepID=UPI0035295709
MKPLSLPFRIRGWFAGILLVTMCAAALPAYAQDTPAPVTMAEIEQAWKANDFVFVREGLKHLAEEEETPLAQYRYGRVLVEGRGGPVDMDEAVVFLSRAAEQNHVEAMTLLARIYLSNISQDQDNPTALARDTGKAADLLSRAAALGDDEAQYYLALLYREGNGVAQDNKAAFNWLLAAAQQEHAESQYELSRLYSRGIGTEHNNAQALAWLERAADNNHVEAQYFLAAAYESGRGVQQSISTAIEWYRRAAENGLPIAQRSLGTYYLKGETVPQNVDEGLRWLTTAAKAGDPGAMVNIAVAYATGMGVERNDETAADWYNRASEYGLGRAKVALGRFYEVGRGVEQDMDRAIALYQQALDTKDANQAALRLGQLAANGTLEGRFAPQTAIPWALYAAQNADADAEAWLAAQAEAGIRDAQSGLAALYLDSEDQDRIAAGAKMLEQAAMGGDAPAQARLGEMYMTGTHVELDYVAAHKWFNIAATLGQTKAVELRETINALMTPEQVAEAQAAARGWFDNHEPQPPETSQTVTVDQ